jgi:hypothetical protein
LFKKRSSKMIVSHDEKSNPNHSGDHLHSELGDGATGMPRLLGEEYRKSVRHTDKAQGSPGSLIEEGLRYMQLGWLVIPVRGKIAAIPWKHLRQQRPDEDTVKEWFRLPNVTGLAVVLGQASGGLACRDFDNRKSYYRWAETYGDLAKILPTARTFKGFHVYSLGPDRFVNLGAGEGEYRGTAGQYVILPPSRHPDGMNYEWVNKPTFTDLPFLEPLLVGFVPSPLPVTESGLTEQTEQTEQAEASGGKLIQLRGVEEGVGGDDVERAITATLPSGPGQRNHCVFRLARALKSIPRLSGADPRDLKPVVRRWHKLALRFIDTKVFDETWADFLQAWPRIKFKDGANPMESLVARAFASEPPASMVDCEDPTLIKIACLCRELQRASGSAPFFLACRTAGKHLGVSRQAVWKWMKLLRDEGLLVEISKGSQKTGKASRYRWVGGE